MQIDQDLHIHTNLSLCAKKEATLECYIRKAAALGVTTLGIANHFWDEKIPGAIEWYRKQNYDHICELKKDIAASQDCGVRILFGAEAEYDYAGRGIAVTEERAAELDYLLVPNSHTHMTMPQEYVTDHQCFADFMYTAYEDILNSPVSRYVTAIVHPFAAVCCPFNNEELIPLISDRRYCRIFERTALMGIALEINTATTAGWSFERLRKSPFLHLYELGKKCGCRFMFGSDAHAEEAMSGQIGSAYMYAALLDLTDKDIRRI